METQTITLTSGIRIVITATTDVTGFVVITSTIHEMDIESGDMVSHIGGRPKKKK